MGAFCRLRIGAGLAGGSLDCDELCLQHVHSVGERISARALRIPARLGCLHSLFGPVGALAFGRPCPISLFGALAECGSGRL
jgi:hypothetical protein